MCSEIAQTQAWACKWMGMLGMNTTILKERFGFVRYLHESDMLRKGCGYSSTFIL